MNNILIRINAERLKLKANDESQCVINLTVDQGFQLLREFNEQLVVNHDRNDVNEILAAMDVQRMIDFYNAGARVYGLPVRIYRMVE
jgi:hypothetical protein